MDAKQLTTLVVRPTLKRLGLYSLAAEQLIVGTIYVESKAKYLKQIGGGPALGVIQMEPATYWDIWQNYLAYKPALANKVAQLAGSDSLDDDFRPNTTQLISNLAFAVAMCRVHYLRNKSALPEAGNISALGKYWKEHYNTHLGAGTVAKFVKSFPTEILNMEDI